MPAKIFRRKGSKARNEFSKTRGQRRPKTMKGKQIMKHQNITVIAIAFTLAFALAPVIKASPIPGGVPTTSTAANQQPSSEGENLPMVTIHSAGNVVRGKTGSFVLDMKPALGFAAMYVNFKVSGTAVAGVDYVALVSPAYIGQSGYATILVKTLRDPRGSSSGQKYSVVVTLEPGAGYALGNATGGARSATIWIEPSAISNW
jgi:hypothetical protein